MILWEIDIIKYLCMVDSLPNIFDVYTENINFDAIISLIDSCFNNTNVSLKYVWSLQSYDTITNGINIDMNKHNSLISFLETQISFLETQSYDTNTNGVNYIFQLDIECIGDCNCFVTDILSLKYKYCDIECQINGGNKNIDLQLSEINLLKLQLIGNEWTFDPDNNIIC